MRVRECGWVGGWVVIGVGWAGWGEWAWGVALVMVGYFQRMSWFCVKPCDESSSRSLGFHSSAHTWRGALVTRSCGRTLGRRHTPSSYYELLRVSACAWAHAHNTPNARHAHTWEPVSTSCCSAPVAAFQKQMRRSAVPPPDASRPAWCGLHASALTAACERE